MPGNDVCPCKILFGNYYEGLKLGADDLVLFGGPDTCRLGFLARPQAERLQDAGFRFTPHTLSLRTIAVDLLRVTRELAEPSPRVLVEAARTLMASLSLMDGIKQETLGLRPRELVPIMPPACALRRWPQREDARVSPSFRLDIKQSWLPCATNPAIGANASFAWP